MLRQPRVTHGFPHGHRMLCITLFGAQKTAVWCCMQTSSECCLAAWVASSDDRHIASVSDNANGWDRLFGCFRLTHSNMIIRTWLYHYWMNFETEKNELVVIPMDLGWCQQSQITRLHQSSTDIEVIASAHACLNEWAKFTPDECQCNLAHWK